MINLLYEIYQFTDIQCVNSVEKPIEATTTKQYINITITCLVNNLDMSWYNKYWKIFNTNLKYMNPKFFKNQYYYNSIKNLQFYLKIRTNKNKYLLYNMKIK